ncbi:amidohydrolase [Archaeoglobus neptunius]|uniref:amidohydrolase n=1 Tax=Archaeoglobus neptunius TaxID=2798580 RepID=UPI001928E027|nr:amidohydrolase [Archaeoglobus neptunius]
MILIRDAKVLTPSGVKKTNVLIEENRISAVGDVAEKGDVVIEGKGKAVIPGFFNTHTHAAMTLFRSYADDMVLHEWLEKKIWPLEAKLDDEAVYWGTKLACIEMLKSGTVFFNDMYFYPSAIARAAEECGMRACVSAAFFDFFNPDLLEENLKKAVKELKKIERYSVMRSIGPHAVYTVSIEGLRRAAEIADEMDIYVHFHLAETEKEVLDFKKQHGKPIALALDEIGFLSRRLITAHCVWLEDGEIELLSRRGVTVSHCPTSNMKLCVGKAINYGKMKRAGVNFTIGTDGAASNNNLDILEEMKFAALLQKFYYSDPTLMGSDEVFEAATINAARAFNLNSGRIEEGCLADLVIVDLKKPYLQPDHNLVASLVYSATSGCVDTVIIDGTIVVENGYFRGDAGAEEKIIEKASRVAEKLTG